MGLSHTLDLSEVFGFRVPLDPGDVPRGGLLVQESAHTGQLIADIFQIIMRPRLG